MQSKNHFLLIDFLKVFAALIIILHHLSSYGQLAEDARQFAPTIMNWLFEYGRFAVQIFLVMGGYLAAQSLTKTADLHNPRQALRLIINRYLRLFTPYVVALLFTILCAWITRFWVQDEFVGESETLGQFLAHLFFLQGILGLDSISAGVWYVAIDWQLYAVLALMLGMFPNLRFLIWVAAILIVASMLYFNRQSHYENYFIYFIGAYGLGVLACLAKTDADTVLKRLALMLIAVIGVIILLSSFHELWVRNILAYAVALLLILLGGFAYKNYNHTKMHNLVLGILWGSRRSYCAFLIHFSFILIANALYIASGLSVHNNGAIALGFMLAALGLSWVAANYLYRLVEVPTRQLKL